MLCQNSASYKSESIPFYVSSVAVDLCVSVTDWPVAKGALLFSPFSSPSPTLLASLFHSEPPLYSQKRPSPLAGMADTERGGRERGEREAAFRASERERGSPPRMRQTGRTATGGAAAAPAIARAKGQTATSVPSFSVEDKQRLRQQRRGRSRSVTASERASERNTSITNCSVCGGGTPITGKH